MYAARRRQRSLLGCIGTLLLTLLVVIAVVGWFRNWYDVAGRDGPDEIEVGLRIHKEEVGRDLGKLRDEARRLTDTADVATDLQTLEGTVTAVSATELTLVAGELEHRVMIDEVTEYYADTEKANRQAINEGDLVRVTYQETDDLKRAARVTVLPAEEP
jgi:hypothetical protein